jgi:hypothetical protein
MLRMTRILAWACAGLLVAVGWAVYFANASKSAPIRPFVSALAYATQPVIGLAVSSFKGIAITVPWAVIVNAATYALAGWIIDCLRRRSAASRRLLPG